MKFERFLKTISKLLQLGDIDIPTTRKIILVFEESLSDKQKERWKIELVMIKSYKSAQTKL